MIEDISSANYFSLSYGNPTDPKLTSSLPYGYTDRDPKIRFFTEKDVSVPSPYYYPNPTSGCYTEKKICSNTTISPPRQQSMIKGNVNVYRLDRETSAFIEGDQYRPGDCLFTYLFAILSDTQPSSITDCSTFQIKKSYGIIEYPVPSSVYTSCQTYPKDIDVQYWSVSSHLCNIGESPSFVPFWTVNAQMIYEISKNGYGYIIWAPYEEVVSRIKDPKSPIPPLISLPFNDQQAYLLLLPSLAFIFRYREPDPLWKGNPIYAPCTENLDDMFHHPITNELISPDGTNWCPQIYGTDSCSSLEEFVNSLSKSI